jgi:hypothetical protein
MDGKISLVLRLQCTYYFEINKSGIQCARAVVLSKHATHCSLPSVWRLKVNTSYAGGTILPMPHCIEDKHLVIYVIKENDCKRGTDLAYNCFPLILCLYHIVFYFFLFFLFLCIWFTRRYHRSFFNNRVIHFTYWLRENRMGNQTFTFQRNLIFGTQDEDNKTPHRKLKRWIIMTSPKPQVLAKG